MPPLISTVPETETAAIELIVSVPALTVRLAIVTAVPECPKGPKFKLALEAAKLTLPKVNVRATPLSPLCVIVAPVTFLVTVTPDAETSPPPNKISPVPEEPDNSIVPLTVSVPSVSTVFLKSIVPLPLVFVELFFNVLPEVPTSTVPLVLAVNKILPDAVISSPKPVELRVISPSTVVV